MPYSQTARIILAIVIGLCALLTSAIYSGPVQARLITGNKLSKVVIQKVTFNPSPVKPGNRLNMQIILTNPSAVKTPAFQVHVIKGRQVLHRLPFRNGLNLRAQVSRTVRFTLPRQIDKRIQRLCYTIRIVPRRGARIQTDKPRVACVAVQHGKGLKRPVPGALKGIGTSPSGPGTKTNAPWGKRQPAKTDMKKKGLAPTIPTVKLVYVGIWTNTSQPRRGTGSGAWVLPGRDIPISVAMINWSYYHSDLLFIKIYKYPWNSASKTGTLVHTGFYARDIRPGKSHKNTVMVSNKVIPESEYNKVRTHCFRVEIVQSSNLAKRVNLVFDASRLKSGLNHCIYVGNY